MGVLRIANKKARVVAKAFGFSAITVEAEIKEFLSIKKYMYSKIKLIKTVVNVSSF